MGFYGNITNTARTQFQFDIIYPNKTEMVKNQTLDGVYAGRYVLIEYDTETHTDQFQRVYIKNNAMYTSANFDTSTRLTQSNVDEGTIVFTAEDTALESGYPLTKCAFYVITSKKTGSTATATFDEIVSAGTKSNYTYNYNIDMAKGEEGRGYDSTVWQKTYINGVEKYVMIAELNSVVPTFNIVADAPMMAPITPHFDIESTDIYYKLHWQTPWGFRVAEANGTNITQTNNNKASLPSDEKTTYIKNTYNEDTGKNVSETSSEYNAAIYYNAAGFKPEKRTRSTYKDHVDIQPTGKSGNKYNTHVGGADNMSVQPDIMEFSFILPSLGNTICDIWDIIYSEDRNRDIEWKDAVDGVENDDFGGMTRDLETVAGCINSVHDLMGMIITDKDNATANEDWYNKHYLYESNGTYYRIAKETIYTYPDDATVGTEDSFRYYFVEVPEVADKLSTIYGCILQMRELMGTELDEGTKDRTTVQGSINVLNDLIDLFEHKIEKSCPVITNSKGQLCTSSITTTQMYSAENWASPANNIAETTKDKAWVSYSVDGDNKEIEVVHTFNGTDDTTTTKNINGNGDTIITYAPIVDAMGHVVGKNTETTTLPFGYKNIVVGEASAVVSDVVEQKNTLVAANTQDTITFKPSNKWIKMQGNGKVVSVSHEVHSFTDGQANTEYGLSANKTVTELDKNNGFEVPVFKFDEAGHITGARTHTIAIPKNFSTVAVKNRGKEITAVNSSAQDADLEADTLTDTIEFDTGNRWIIMTGNAGSNKVTISHAAPGNTTYSTQTGNETPLFGEEFKIPEVKYDEAGHISGIATHTVKVPQPSMTDITASNASVLTGISMTDSTGAITPTYGNVGERELTGYALGTNSNKIADTDSINKAFGKVQVQLDNEVENRTNAVASEQSRAEGEESKLLTAINTEAATARANEQTLTNNLATEISNRKAAIATEKERAEKVESDLSTAITNEVSDRENAITNEVAARDEAISEAINALDVETIGGADNEYISSIVEVDGKISATTATLPDYTDYWNQISTLNGELEKANETIEQLTNDLATAQSNITDILERLAKLETIEEEPIPEE